MNEKSRKSKLISQEVIGVGFVGVYLLKNDI